MLLSELAEKEIIEVKNGIRYGFLANTECIFDEATGKVQGFEIQSSALKSIFKNKQSQSQTFIRWQDILLIGEDRILFTETNASLKKRTSHAD